jgi:hypothetical protein
MLVFICFRTVNKNHSHRATRHSADKRVTQNTSLFFIAF